MAAASQGKSLEAREKADYGSLRQSPIRPEDIGRVRIGDSEGVGGGVCGQ